LAKAKFFFDKSHVNDLEIQFVTSGISWLLQ